MEIGDFEEWTNIIFPFGVKCFFDSVKNLSTNFFPPLHCGSSGGSGGRYGVLNTIKSNFSEIFENKSDWTKEILRFFEFLPVAPKREKKLCLPLYSGGCVYTLGSDKNDGCNIVDQKHH